MAAPESPFNLNPNWRVEGSPITAVALIENEERRQSFHQLFLEIARLYFIEPVGQAEILHETYLTDGSLTNKRTVVLAQEEAVDSTALTRVFINDESTSLDLRRQLNIREYAVTASPAKRIACSKSYLIRGYGKPYWEPQDDTGPILRKHNNTVDIYKHAPAPEFIVPDSIVALRHNIDQRLLAQELYQVLHQLGTVSREPGYEFVYRQG